MNTHNRKSCQKPRFLILLWLCALLLSLAAPTVFAAEPETVKVGYMLHEGYQEGGPGEVKSGYGYEYLQMLRNYTGWEYEYVYTASWEEQVSMLQRGEIDLMLHAFRTPERMQTMLFSVEPMGRETNYLYTRGDHPTLVAGDVDSLNGKTVGCMAGDFRHSIFSQWCKDNSVVCTVTSYSDLAAMHKDLSSGKIDAVIGSDFTSGPYSGDWVTILRLDEQSIYIAVRLGREDLLAQVNAAQSQILAINPYYPDEVRRKYQDIASTHIPPLTQAQKDVLARRDTLKVGYCAGHRPIAYTDAESGELRGVLSDYLAAMTQVYGIAFQVLPFENDIALLDALKSGNVDIIAPVGYGYGMAENSGVLITNPLTVETMIAVFKGYEGTQKKDIYQRIAVLKHSVTEKDYARRFYPNSVLVEANTVEQALTFVNSGVADCYMLRSSTYSWYKGEYRLLNDLQFTNLPNSSEINMSVRSEDVELLPILNKGISLLDENDVTSALVAYADVQEDVTWLTMMQDNPITTTVGALSILLLVGLVIVLSKLQAEKKYLVQLENAKLEAENAKAEAEQASHAKSTFLTSISHDIRTPMNAIIGMTTLASKHLNSPDYIRNCLGKVTLASDHLLTLINDVLDINKIETGNLSLNPTVFSLADSIMNLANIGRHQLQEKNHHFDIRIHNVKQEYLFADELRINQIFINILSNAVKYTPAGGSITVDVKQAPVPGERGKVRLTYMVKDTGIGMSQEFQDHMYELFAMANRNTGTVTGSGVGLSICKQLVDLMGGSIVCESAPDMGTTFTVTLDIPVADRVVDELVLPPMKLLLVDDDEVFLATASDTLRDLGLSADCVNSGEKAIKVVTVRHAEGKDYPLIIIDWRMPGMDGIETTRAIRKTVGPEVSIIVISAYAPEEIGEAAIAAGANGFINKPFFRSSAFQSISQILGLEVEQNTQNSHSHSNVQGMHLLIAEDNDLNWEIAHELLSMYGITADRAEDGQKCLDILSSSKVYTYNAVLMDIQMPVMNGYDATVAIRAHPRADIRSIPVVAMTADAYTEDVVRCAEVGMNAHVPKPIDMDRLLSVLGELR